ncbi:MAG TPA: hypothetical protein VMG58_15405 [Candidatus Sulfotelmatobacter sp.]|nr:hypothetical protein [Candidatus Sulfotelmatobacter sp.]
MQELAKAEALGTLRFRRLHFSSMVSGSAGGLIEPCESPSGVLPSAKHPGNSRTLAPNVPPYLGCPYWIYEPASGQWYHTLDQDAPDDIGPFPSEEEAIGKAILRIGAVVTEERRKLGLL